MSVVQVFKFRKGDTVILTEAGKKALVSNHPKSKMHADITGKVTNPCNPYSGLVSVLVDGYRLPKRFHPDFWMSISDGGA